MDVTDEELAALALAADPDTAVPDDAVPLQAADGSGQSLLPGWYMPSPAPGSRLRRRWARVVVALIIASFLAINAYGLCSTYGPVRFG